MNDALEFWNNRAKLKAKAGTNDLIAKQLEMKAIMSYVKKGMSILDYGCGNGITALEIAKQFDVSIIGVDYSEEMIKEANAFLSECSDLKGKVDFIHGDVDSIAKLGTFDMIYTERVIINRKPWDNQKQLIRTLLSAVNENGIYVMCENFEDGVDTLNKYREELGLDKIIPPWHNRYLKHQEVLELSYELQGEIDYRIWEYNSYSSLYYFLSRIVNAYVSKQIGEEPNYDSFINQLALFLPPQFVRGDFAQGRIYVWRKGFLKHKKQD